MGMKENIGQKEKTPYLRFYQEIMGVSSTFKSKHQKDILIDEEAQKNRSQKGLCLIDRGKLKIDQKLLDELFQVFLPISKKYESFFDLKIQELEREKEKIDLSKLVRFVLMEDLDNLKSLAQKHNLNPDVLLFFGLNLSQTLLEIYAQELKEEIDHENWLKGNCPLCGSHPAMEKLRREDGKRILWCGFCGTQWHHKRIMCPFCGNEDHNSLRYFFTEGESSSGANVFRVDVCDKCKRYIKTIDERKMPEGESPDFRLENINTLYLDILAQKDGYQSPTYWMTALSEKNLV